MQFNSRLRNKIDTSSQWTQINPVILDGELIFVKTSDGKIRAKVGDGVKTYTQLPFLDEDIYNQINKKIDTSEATEKFKQKTDFNHIRDLNIPLQYVSENDYLEEKEAGYNYKIQYDINDVTNDMTPFVTFSVKDAISGNFCPTAQSYTSGIILFCKEIPQSIIIKDLYFIS